MKNMMVLVLMGTALGRAAAGGTDRIGRIDTVGGTVYDYWYNRHVPRGVWYDSTYGAHAIWPYSLESGGSYPDLNVRYNFYDISTQPPEWVFIEPGNYLLDGVNVFSRRVRFGNLDVDPGNGWVLFSGTAQTGPVVARSRSGVFEECDAPAGYLWPLISVGHSGKTHAGMMLSPGGTDLYYSGMDTWNAWSVPYHIPPPMPDPGFPSFEIAASKRSANVAMVWLAGDSPRQIYWRRSTDDGVTWLAPDTLSLPPAFTPGSDTLVSGVDIFPWYDPDEEEEDVLHLAAVVCPVVGDTGLIMPAEVWHWGESLGWSRVARAGCDPEHLMGNTGGAPLAGRPSLGSDGISHGLICVWEQFDSSNVEPQTGELRADLWGCRADSGGRRWGTAVRLTDPGTSSKRFPCVANRPRRDTCLVLYLEDQVAGYAVQGVGVFTNNPVILQWVPLAQIPPPVSGGVTETASLPASLSLTPNPCSRAATLRYSLPRPGNVKLALYDVSGRLVTTLVNGYHPAGLHTCALLPTRSSLVQGVYVLQLKTAGIAVSRKVIVE